VGQSFEKLIVPKATQEISRIFLTNRRFIPVLNSTPFVRILSHKNAVTLILSFRLRLGLPSGLTTAGFRTKTPYALLVSPHTRHMSRSAPSLWSSVQGADSAVLLLQYCRTSTLSPTV